MIGEFGRTVETTSSTAEVVGRLSLYGIDLGEIGRYAGPRADLGANDPRGLDGDAKSFSPALKAQFPRICNSRSARRRRAVPHPASPIPHEAHTTGSATMRQVYDSPATAPRSARWVTRGSSRSALKAVVSCGAGRFRRTHYSGSDKTL